MLTKTAIKQFLERPRRDLGSYKRLPENRIEELRAALPVQPPTWRKLHLHQKACFIVGVKLKRCAFLLDTGMGKTLLSLALIRYFRHAGEIKRALVLVPNKANKFEWAREIEKHSRNTPYRILTGGSMNKWQQLDKRTLIVIETYAGLSRMVCDLVDRPGGKKKSRLVPNRDAVAMLVDEFDCLVLDESTHCKNHRSLPYRICRQISKHANAVFALTGTPFGRDPGDLWAQLYLIDHGQSLGQTLGLFRAAFFTASKNYWGGFEYTFQQKKSALLNRLLAHSTVRYEADEADLPELVPIVKHVSLPADAEVYYRRARDTIIASRGNYREMKNAFLRMRQISSGFLGYYDDEAGSKADFEFQFKPKLELLLSIVSTIRPDRKVVIFHDFIFSGSMICRALAELKIEHVRLDGRTKKPDDVLRRFDSDARCRVLVLNSAAGGFGLNLQVANYGIYYESPVSVIMRRQTQRRIERQGSVHARVFVYDLVVRGTVDQHILEFHRQGADLFKAIVEGRVTV